MNRTLLRAATAMYLFSTFTFRSRDSSELAAQLIDSAGAVRMGLLMAAGLTLLLSGFPLLRFRGPAAAYAAYAATATLGVLAAVSPTLVLFRVVELTFVALLATAWMSCAGLLGFIYNFIRLNLVSVVITAAIVPSLAFTQADGGIYAYRLRGVIPTQSANGVGSLAVVALLIAYSHPKLRSIPWATFSVVILLATQYRTGWIAAAVGLVIIELPKGHMGRRVTVIASGFCVAAGLAALDFGRVWQRGQSDTNLSTLSGRTRMWETGLDVVERSPIVGTGLSSGTRLEVVAQLGDSLTAASTLHNTWIEILVGTGIVGVAAAATFVVMVGRRAIAAHPSLRPCLVAVFVATIIRGGSGTTFELGGWMALLLVAIAYSGENSRYGTHSPINARTARWSDPDSATEARPLAHRSADMNM